MPFAVFEGLRSGILPSVTMSQAIIESGWGKSSLSKSPYYNFFGIKAHGNPNYVEMPTKEYVNGQYITINSKFRDYLSPYGSFKDHTDFLKKYPNYDEVFEYNDYIGQTNALKKGGYATSPTYNYALQNMIEKNNLDRNDWLVKYRFILLIIFLIGVSFLVYLIIKRQNSKK